jgi:hypothetical protein
LTGNHDSRRVPVNQASSLTLSVVDGYRSPAISRQP